MTVSTTGVGSGNYCTTRIQMRKVENIGVSSNAVQGNNERKGNDEKSSHACRMRTIFDEVHASEVLEKKCFVTSCQLWHQTIDRHIEPRDDASSIAEYSDPGSNIGPDGPPILDRGPTAASGTSITDRPGDHQGMRPALRFANRMFYHPKQSLQSRPSQPEGRRGLICAFLSAANFPEKIQLTARRQCCSLSRRLRWSSLFIAFPTNLPHAPASTRHRKDLATATMSEKKPKTKQRAKPRTERTPAETVAMLQKAEMIHDKLKELYPVAPEGFLEHKDPFTLLCATVLSAQCLDSTVNSVTPALFAEGGTPAEMRDLGAARIKTLIARVGLSDTKSKYLQGLSAKLCADHDGVVPDTLEALESLPGVGHKTASVVLIQAFGKPAFPVDTHIHRLACRWGIGNAKSVEKTEAAYKEWFPDPAVWAPLHTRLIIFGREHCPARMHDMDACPICSFAATAEARSKNKMSPRKFVAPSAHRNPYSIWSSVPEDTGPFAAGGAPSPGVKRRRTTADAETPLTAADSATELASSLQSTLPGTEVTEPVMATTAGGKKAAVGKKGKVAKPATPKKAGKPKATKAKAAAPKGVRKSARIAAQK